MTEDVNPVLLQEVQTSLEKYVKKPPLTDKLLKKPPFRYLHDLISTIIRETGFLNGLYAEDELNSDNIKDKDAKIHFLDKLISAIKTVTGKNVAARSAKIIAGLEVNKTLELLSIIGKAIDDKVDFSSAITEVPEKEAKKTKKSITKDKKIIKPIVPKRKGSDPVSESKPKNTTLMTKNETSKTEKNNHENSTSNTPSKLSKIKDVQKRENSIKRQDTEGSSNVSEPSNENSKNQKEVREKNLTRKRNISEKSSPSSRRNSSQSKSSPARKTSVTENNRNLSSAKNIIKEEENDNVATSKEIKSDAKEWTVTQNGQKEEIQNHFINGEEMNKTASKPQNSDSPAQNEISVKKKDGVPVQRPSSARPGSRRFSYSNSLNNGDVENSNLKEKKPDKKPEDTDTPIVPVSRPRTATRPPSARPGAPRIRDRGEVSVADETKTAISSVNVIEEGKQDPFPDEKDNFIIIESKQNVPAPSENLAPLNDQEQGQLVHQILKTQKELNESVAVENSQNKISEIEWETGRQRERDFVTKEIDRIRGFIQTLTGAANPLGKLFDFLQEDVDEMQRELQHWRKINENLQKQQLTEIEIGKMFLQPLQKQLEDVENSIEEEYLQIANIKNIILSDDEKILKLISGPKTRTK